MADQQETMTVPVLEEEIRVDKQPVVTGRVRVSNPVETVQEIARLSLAADRVEVTRVRIDREVDTVPPVRTEGDVTIVPIFEEIMVVEKRLVLREELHVRRQVSTEIVEVPVILRKQRGVVERVSAGPNTGKDEEQPT